MDDNTVEYCIPECTTIAFLIPPQERYLSFKLMFGSATLRVNDEQVFLPFGREYMAPLWTCLNPELMSDTRCRFVIRGNHYVRQAVMKVENEKKKLFWVSVSEDFSVFGFSEMIQLGVIVSESSSECDVSMESCHGATECLGYRLIPRKKYVLQPCSSVLLNSPDEKKCAVRIHGKLRRVTVLYVGTIAGNTRRQLDNIMRKVSLAETGDNCVSLSILVTGPKNVGKTSYCHFLINKALDYGLRPVYVDLNVCRNSYAIPGAISFSEIDSRLPSYPAFKFNSQSIFQYGSIDFKENNVWLYPMLIRNMGEILRINNAKKKSRCLTIIDMCGTLGEDNAAVDCVLRSFANVYVFFIGDQSSYLTLTNSILKRRPSAFIPRPNYVVPLNEAREKKMREIVLRQYFYGTILKPLSPKLFEAKFTDFQLCRITLLDVYRESMSNNAIGLKHVKCEPRIEYYILGVRKSVTRDVRSMLSEVDYFVCFTKVDVERKTVTVLSPVAEPISGKILTIGNIEMVKD